MDIPLNAKIFCTDGECGKLIFVIVNPHTDDLTHIVVKESKRLHKEHLVPISKIEKNNKEQITLNCSKKELSKEESFIKTHFVKSKVVSQYWSVNDDSLAALQQPYVYIHDEFRPVKYQAIPPEELSVHRGEKVVATDGTIGNVDELLINKDGHITHLVLREGHLWGKKDVAIPVTEIDKNRSGKQTVYLNLNKETVEKLPAIPIKRKK